MTDFSSDFLISVLPLASKLGHLAMVQHLLPDSPKEAINAALLQAALKGHLALLRVLLAAGADAHLDPTGGFMDQVVLERLSPRRTPGNQGSDALIALVDAGGVVSVGRSAKLLGMNGSLPLLQRIFARNPPQQQDLESLLTGVVMHNSLDVVRYCVELAEERGYELPLARLLPMVMFVHPAPGVVDFLLAHLHVDVLALQGDFLSGSPADLGSAAKASSVTIAETLLATPGRDKLYSYMLRNARDPAVLRVLLRDPAAIEWDGFHKYPVLMGACQELSLESVRMLLAAGAKAGEIAREGSPLYYAVTANCAPERVGDKIAVINALLDAGAKPVYLLSSLFGLCRPSNDGPPPESYRVETLLAALLARLPELPQLRDKDDGATGLIELARDHPGETRLMQMLIEAGADVRAVDKSRVSVISHLLKSSAGRPAKELQRARQSLRLLLAVGVDPAKSSRKGTTLLMRAAKGPSDDVSDRAGCLYIVDIVDAVAARVEARSDVGC
jgi:ankyrin repeat protein